MLLKAYRIRNDSCITCLYAVHSRQPGGGRCCSSDISFGFLKEASTCRIEEALDVRFHDEAIGPKLEGPSKVSDRIQGPDRSSVAITARQEVLLIDRLQSLCHSRLKELVLHGGNAYSTLPLY